MKMPIADYFRSINYRISSNSNSDSAITEQFSHSFRGRLSIAGKGFSYASV